MLLAFPPRGRCRDAVVRSQARCNVRRESLLGAPARRAQAKEGDRRVHRVLVLPTSVDGRVAREVVKREWDAQSARTDARLRDELCALGSALFGCLALEREARDQSRVRRNGLTQISAHCRVLPGIEGQCARDLKAVTRLGQRGE